MPLSCPTCASPDHSVKDSRPYGDYIARRRKCDHCGARFTTHERLVADKGMGGIYAQVQTAADRLAKMLPRHRAAVCDLIVALTNSALTPDAVQDAIADQEEQPNV